MIQPTEAFDVANGLNNYEPELPIREMTLGIADYFDLRVTDYVSAEDFMTAAFRKMEIEDLRHFMKRGSEGLKEKAIKEIRKRGINL